MSHCEEYAALLDGFVDGELPVQELERVQAHLDDCPDCRAYVDDALAIRAAFPQAEEAAVPEGFAQSVMDRVARTPQDHASGQKPAAGRRRRWQVWGGTAAAAACVVLILQLSLHGRFQSYSTDVSQAATGGASVSGEVLPETAGEELIQERSIPEDDAACAADAWETPEGQPAPEADEAKSAEFPMAGATPVQNGTADNGAAPEEAEDTGEAAKCRLLAELFQTIQTPLEQSPRVELPAEQGDLLAAYTALADEEGRACYLLEREAYNSLLLALAEREASQPVELYVPAAAFAATVSEPPPVVVYLAEG